MGIFYIGCIIIFAGLGAVGWLLYSEKKSSSLDETIEPEESSIDPEEAAKMLDRLGLATSQETNTAAKKPGLFSLPALAEKLPFLAKIPFLKDKLNNLPEEDNNEPLHLRDELPDAEPQKPLTGTASIRPVSEIPPAEAPVEYGQTPPAEQELQNEPTSVSENIQEWQKKYERLDMLFKEKSEGLEKAEQSLENELKHRKEFNKVKDILEKEIKDLKVKCRSLQVELTGSESENESAKKRILQLEEKVTSFQKQITEYEDSLKERDKEILTLRKKTESSPASTAIKPPAAEPERAPETIEQPTGKESTESISAPAGEETASETFPEQIPETPAAEQPPAPAAEEEPPTLASTTEAAPEQGQDSEPLQLQTQEPATQFYLPENQEVEPTADDSAKVSQPIKNTEDTQPPEPPQNSIEEEESPETRFSPAGEELKPISNLEGPDSEEGASENSPPPESADQNKNSESAPSDSPDEDSKPDPKIILNVLENIDAMSEENAPSDAQTNTEIHHPQPQESDASRDNEPPESEDSADSNDDDGPSTGMKLPPDILQGTDNSDDEGSDQPKDEENKE